MGEKPQLVNEVLRYGFKNMNTSEEYTLGIIAVIHAFGKVFKWNPHVHAIVTKRGVGKTSGCYVNANMDVKNKNEEFWINALITMLVLVF